MKVGMFEQALCKEVVSPLPECFMEIHIYDSGTLPLSSIIKSKPVDENQIEAAVRNIRVDGIKVNIQNW